MKTPEEVAAQCWCDPTTSKKEMDIELCEVFVKALNAYADERLALAIEKCVDDGQIALAIEIRDLKSKP